MVSSYLSVSHIGKGSQSMIINQQFFRQLHWNCSRDLKRMLWLWLRMGWSRGIWYLSQYTYPSPYPYSIPNSIYVSTGNRIFIYSIIFYVFLYLIIPTVAPIFSISNHIYIIYYSLWPHELADPLPVFVPGLTSRDMGPSLVRGALKSVATKDGNGRTRMTLITIIKKSIYIWWYCPHISTWTLWMVKFHEIYHQPTLFYVEFTWNYMNEFPYYDVFQCLSMSKVKNKDIFKQNNLSGLLAVYYPSSVDSWDQNVELCRHGESTNSRCTQGELRWNPYGNLIINNNGYTCKQQGRRILVRTAVPENLMVDFLPMFLWHYWILLALWEHLRGMFMYPILKRSHFVAHVSRKIASIPYVLAPNGGFLGDLHRVHRVFEGVA